MVVKEHPEWKNKYQAVDGFKYDTKKKKWKDLREYPGEFFGQTRVKNPIRSDIEKILKLNDEDFTKWFSERKITAQRLLKEYEIIGTIPCLTYGFEDMQYNMSAIAYFNNTIKNLKEGIEYLDIIKQVRDEQRE